MGEMPSRRWVFRAVALRVVDGDTVDVEIDGGFRNYQQERLRLLGVNAPERQRPTFVEGEAARVFVSDWLGRAGETKWPLVIQTIKGDVFGRYLATVWRTVDGACLNADLLAAGHAVEDVR